MQEIIWMMVPNGGTCRVAASRFTEMLDDLGLGEGTNNRLLKNLAAGHAVAVSGWRFALTREALEESK
jgi:Fe2+ transport system protein FeoA